MKKSQAERKKAVIALARIAKSFCELASENGLGELDSLGETIGDIDISDISVFYNEVRGSGLERAISIMILLDIATANNKLDLPSFSKILRGEVLKEIYIDAKMKMRQGS